MTQSASWLMVLRCLAVASAMVIAPGCTATRPTDQSAPSSSVQGIATSGTPADETPTSARNLVDTADLTTQAEEEGFRPEVRDGDVLYCRKQVDFSELTRIPTQQCLDKDELRLMLQKERQQRDAMQRMTSAPGCSQTGC